MFINVTVNTKKILLIERATPFPIIPSAMPLLHRMAERENDESEKTVIIVFNLHFPL